MTEQDSIAADRALSARLRTMPQPELPPALSHQIRAAALLKLQPRPVRRAWVLAAAGTSLGYLAAALHFALFVL